MKKCTLIILLLTLASCADIQAILGSDDPCLTLSEQVAQETYEACIKETE